MRRCSRLRRCMRELRRARRVVVATLTAALVVLVIAYSGTLTESKWSGSLAPCTRATDIDGSTRQSGTAAMQWMPPMVRCRYSRTDASESPVVLAPAEANEFATLGIAFVAVVLLVVSAPVIAVSVGIRRTRRRDSSRFGRDRCAPSERS
jgi:hypothetical protein